MNIKKLIESEKPVEQIVRGLNESLPSPRELVDYVMRYMDTEATHVSTLYSYLFYDDRGDISHVQVGKPYRQTDFNLMARDGTYLASQFVLERGVKYDRRDIEKQIANNMELF